MNSRTSGRSIVPTGYEVVCSGQDARRVVDVRRLLDCDARKAVQAYDLEYPQHLGLRVAQNHLAPGATQAAGDDRQIEDERAVRERELGEIDDDVALAGEGSGEGCAPPPTRRNVLVSRAAQHCWLFGELDDGRATYTSRGATLKPMPTLEDVEDALSNVIDPELGLDFVELGLIYGVEIEGGDVHVTFTLTTPACPIGPQVTEQIDEFVSELEGVDEVSSSMVFTPPWTPEKMSEDAKFALGF
jgi:metal-sulfur cluster biosynthetic enzyme